MKKTSSLKQNMKLKEINLIFFLMFKTSDNGIHILFFYNNIKLLSAF